MRSMPIDRESTAKQIASNLSRLMDERGLSQVQLATMAGMNTSMSLSRILRCKQEPSATILANLSQSLGVSIDEIVFPPKRSSKKSA